MNVFVFSVIFTCLLLLSGINCGRAQCINGQIKQMDCNNCRCVDGSWACTSRRCPPAVRTKRGRCHPGSEWTKGIKKCSCDANGHQTCVLNSLASMLRKASQLKDARCTGQTKEIDCNNCHCYGRWACVARQCTPPVLPRKVSVHCQPGTAWTEGPEDNKKCSCDANGQTSCIIFHNIAVKIPKASEPEEVSAQCISGQTRRIDCNDCKCIDGRWECTVRKCPPSVRSRIASQCKPGSKWTEKNNGTCSCDDSGQIITCESDNDSGVFPKSTPKPIHCQPGSEWIEGNNKCSCDANGQEISCVPDNSVVAVPRASESTECSLGQTKNLDCNSCVCTGTGKWECTNITCSKS